MMGLSAFCGVVGMIVYLPAWRVMDGPDAGIAAPCQSPEQQRAIGFTLDELGFRERRQPLNSDPGLRVYRSKHHDTFWLHFESTEWLFSLSIPPVRSYRGFF